MAKRPYKYANMTKNDHTKVVPKTEALGFALDQDSTGEGNLTGHSESRGHWQ
jgi:hypothetical protein